MAKTTVAELEKRVALSKHARTLILERLEAVEKALECQREGKHDWTSASASVGMFRMKAYRECLRCGARQNKWCWTKRSLGRFWDGKD